MKNRDLRETEELKTKVLVVTAQRDFSGYLHHTSPDRRETDVLNDEKSFIHLTDVVVRNRGEVTTKGVPFVAVNKANIIYVIPITEE